MSGFAKGQLKNYFEPQPQAVETFFVPQADATFFVPQAEAVFVVPQAAETFDKPPFHAYKFFKDILFPPLQYFTATNTL